MPATLFRKKEKESGREKPLPKGPQATQGKQSTKRVI